MKRGIVVGARVSSSAGFSMNGALENEDLLRWLLYWDEIVYAGLGLGGASITGNHPPDVSYLEAEGVFRTRVVDVGSLGLSALPPPVPGVSMFGLAGNQIPHAEAAARVKLAEELTGASGHIWTVGQSGGEQLILPGVVVHRELIDVQLVNCLPVPLPGTPYNDILEFRAAHGPELARLRLALDALRERILSSADERRMMEATLHELGEALGELHAALRGSRLDHVWKTLSLYTENPSVGFWSCLGGLASAASGLPVDMGVAAGVALPTLCRFAHRTMSGETAPHKFVQDFAYVYNAVNFLPMSPNNRIQRTREDAGR